MSKFISCTATSVQRGSRRFPYAHEKPQLKAWRCDLTALSRSHNFYFVACNDEIYVYQPKFPDQSIPGEPELILTPPTSAPFLEPGIDPQDAHSITRLHVDYLGQDEIVLVTCDDGDVIGYRTEEIRRGIDKRRATEDAEDGFHIEEPVRTFLHRNVGASAWGLAIHQEARIIAISANTHKVTVIAYALAQPTDISGGNPSSSSDVDDHEDSADFPSPRRQDHVITLSARYNIPSVSFNNSADDPSGRWLSSCSISGETLIWDLHHPDKFARNIQLGFCASVRDPMKAPTFTAGSCACLRPSYFPHAVWSTMFLDARASHEDASLRAFAQPRNSHRPLPYILDVGACKNRFSVRGCYHGAAQSHGTLAEEPMDISDDESESVGSESADSPMSIGILDAGQSPLSGVGDSDTETQSAVTPAMAYQQPAQTLSEFGASESSNQPSSQIPTTASALEAFLLSAPSLSVASPPESPHSLAAIGSDGPDAYEDFYSDSSSEYEDLLTSHDRPPHPARPYCEITTASSLPPQAHLKSPLLIVTKEDIHLYQQPLTPTLDALSPIITIRNPLHPEERSNPFPFIPGAHDRHCYTSQIPELGVFIVASPHGRAGVFSLTKSTSSLDSRSQHSFHLEYILPFENGDKCRVWAVEGARLVGVAAGPVQGSLDRGSGDEEDDAVVDGGLPGGRRWRVMMYYSDHTVLAFEMERRDGGLGVGQMIV